MENIETWQIISFSILCIFCVIFTFYKGWKAGEKQTIDELYKNDEITEQTYKKYL